MRYNIDMYIRTISRKNKDGSVVRYIQLAHNVWDPKAGYPKAKVLFNFGREEDVDREALVRLVKSITRFLGPEEALRTQAELNGSAPLTFVSSRPIGGAWVLNELWNQLGINRVLAGLLAKRKFQAPVERAIFAMVANRALNPASKLKTEDWVSHDVFIPGLPDVPVQNLYRAMDFLLEAAEELQKDIFFSVAHLFNLEVDLLYFDTTSTYFEVEEEDNPEDHKQHLRRKGNSKDHRPDLPQVVIGLAVTREGLPVRCWVWPGNTADMAVIEQVKKDLVGWQLGRVITVVDRGFASEDNLRYLQRAGGHYIAGEKMRSGKDTVAEALARPGRYKTVKDNLEVKEVIVGDGEKRVRYVLVRNPKEAEKDRLEREKILARLKEELKAIGDLKGEPHTKACCQLIAHPTYGRYLKTDKKGQPYIDMAKVKAEEKLDGKYLLRTSDDTLSPEDVALGYKQLLEVEEAFRTMKQSLELRPIYHRLSDRIHAHVLLCWLGLLLIRVAETKVEDSWRNIRQTLERMHLGEFIAPDGRVLQRTETTPQQQHIFKALGIKAPPQIIAVETKGQKRSLVTRAQKADP
ncbi:IS1634 family transposase ISDha15 [Neomoorella glycerini]|uniref:IS1634 family transposase ISDha15 n=2 Tax=Neomoorella glycerini TaxID=55779 RepID=A0A6I5ZQX5_9FIRM|nr:IS1634 family transposase [Moorella glycerini]QGP92382.1 IS1634 family transposase ISDha15 [Moorella glycerini]